MRGTRESHLHSMLQRIEVSFKETAKKNLCSRSTSQDADEVSEESPNSMVPDMMEPLASIHIKRESSVLDKNVTLERYRDFEKWMWDECFSIMKLRALKYGKTLRTRLLSICSHCHDLYFFENQHCPFCHKNYSMSVETFNFGEHVSYCKQKQEEVQNRALVKLESSPPLRIRLLKAQLASLEVIHLMRPPIRTNGISPNSAKLIIMMNLIDLFLCLL